MRRFVIFLGIILYCFAQDEPSAPKYAELFNHSELYNERAISKGNGTIPHGNVQISEFSGGLTYIYPLLTQKFSSDGTANLSLVYNSGLSAISMNGFSKRTGTFISPGLKQDVPGRFHTGVGYVNQPGWILNFNGIAVQLFNFERNIVTRAPEVRHLGDPNDWVTPASGINVNRIFKGWHLNFTEQYNPDQCNGNEAGDNDYTTYQIEILSGDGGIDSYRFPQTSQNGFPQFVVNQGHHTEIQPLFDLNKSGVFAYLRTTDSPNRYSQFVREHRDGRIERFRIIYDMTIQDADLPGAWELDRYRAHTTLIPETVEYPDGSQVRFHYDYGATYGQHSKNRLKPVLRSIDYSNSVHTLTIEIEYLSSQVRIKLPGDRIYYLNATGHFSDQSTSISNHVYFRELIDPAGNKTRFEYENYRIRQFGLWGQHHLIDQAEYGFSLAHSVQHDLSRISKIVQPSKEVHDFTYWKLAPGDRLAERNQSMGVSGMANFGVIRYPAASTFYEKTGREAFTTNLMQLHRISDSQGQLLTNRMFDYFYTARSEFNNYHRVSANGKVMILPGDELFTGITESDKPLNPSAASYLNRENISDVSTPTQDFINRIVDQLESQFEPHASVSAVRLNRYQQFYSFTDGNIPEYVQRENTVDTKLINQRTYRFRHDRMELTEDRTKSYEMGPYEFVKAGLAEVKCYYGTMDLRLETVHTYRNGKSHFSSTEHVTEYREIKHPDVDRVPLFRIPIKTRSVDHLGNVNETAYMTDLFETEFTDLMDVMTDHPKMVLPKYRKTGIQSNTDSLFNYVFYEYLQPQPRDYTQIRFLTSNFMYAADSSIVTRDGELIGHDINEVIPEARREVAALTNSYLSDILKNRDMEALGVKWHEWKPVLLENPDGKSWYVPIGDVNPNNDCFDRIEKKNTSYSIDGQNKDGTVYHFPKIFKQQRLQRAFVHEPQASQFDSQNRLTYQFRLADGEDPIAIRYKVLTPVYRQMLMSHNGITIHNLNLIFNGSSSVGTTFSDGSVTANILLTPSQKDSVLKYGIFLFVDPDESQRYDISLKLSDPQITRNANTFLTNQSISVSELNPEMLNDAQFPDHSLVFGKPVEVHQIKRLRDNATHLIAGRFWYDRPTGLLTQAQNQMGQLIRVSLQDTVIPVKRLIDTSIQRVDSLRISFDGVNPVSVSALLPTGVKQTFSATFDPVFGRPEVVINDQGVAVEYRYDRIGRIVSVTPPGWDESRVIRKSYTQTIPALKGHQYKITQMTISEDDGRNFDTPGPTFETGFMYSDATRLNQTTQTSIVKLGHESVNGTYRDGTTILDAEYNHIYRAAVDFAVNQWESMDQIDSITVSFYVSHSGSPDASLMVGLMSTTQTLSTSESVGEFRQFDSGQPILSIDSAGFQSITLTGDIRQRVLLFGLAHNNDRDASYKISDIRVNVYGSKLTVGDRARIVYQYNDSANTVSVFQKTDFTDRYGNYHKLGNRYEFDDHNRFIRQLSFWDTRLLDSHSDISTVSYAADGQVREKTDMFGHINRTGFDRYRTPVTNTHVRADLTDSTTTKQTLTFLTKSEFLDDIAQSASGFQYPPENLLFSGVNDQNYTKSISTDADGNRVAEYKGPRGLKLATIADLDSLQQIVMFHYDFYGNLTQVIHPDSSITEYGYDALFGTLRWKQLPAMSGKIRFVYDSHGRIRASQTPNDVEKHSFSFTGYDAAGREKHRGIYSRSDANSRFEALYNANPVSLLNQMAEEHHSNLISKTQYDDLPDWSDPVWSELPAHKRNLNVNFLRGSAVYTASRSMPNERWAFSGGEPDILGRTVHRFQVDAVSSNRVGNQDQYFYYDRLGRQIKTIHQTRYANITLSEYQWTEYDLFGRVTNVYRSKIDRKPDQPLSSQTYTRDDKIKSHTIGHGLQQLDYSYNYKGWLTSINNPDQVGDDEFAMRITYWDTGNGYRNGNIFRIDSYIPALSDYTEARIRFLYRYDGLNRLRSATAEVNGGNGFRKVGIGTAYDYDSIGNLKRIIRRGGQQ